MIKTRSSHYINTSFISPLSGVTCTAYTIQIYVWNGAKTNAPVNPTYEVTKENPTASTGIDEINIARLINDFVNPSARKTNTTEVIDGNNNLWVKHNVLYTTTDPDDLNVPQNIAVDLIGRAYGYGDEGENPTTPADNILLQGREFNVSRDGVFVLPILADEIPSTLDAVNETFNIIYQTTILDVLANDDLGFTPTNIAQITTSMPSEVGTLEITNNTVVFTPGVGLVTPQTFTYTLIDSTAESDIATVTINISAVPSTVLAVNDYFAVNNTDAVVLDVMANDVLGTEPTDIISFVDSGLTSGAITNNGTDLTFTPNGVLPVINETFTYTIQDDTPTSSQAIVTLQVTSIGSANRHLLEVDNANTFNAFIQGTYSDTNLSFGFFVPAGGTVSVNRCVIESSLTVITKVFYTFDDLITC